MAQNAVSGGSEGPFTTVSVDGKRAIIETQLLSFFFEADTPAPVLVDGVCALTFTNDSSAQQFRNLRGEFFENRLLQASLEGDEAKFDIVLDLLPVTESQLSASTVWSSHVFISVFIITSTITLVF